MANFCNQFDKVCTELKVAVIYCHHHSKGSQGGKKSMDRASGSGVFARDPDAMLDMIELELPEETQKAEENKAVCEACKQYLNAHFKWEDDLSQDDLCSSYQMMNYCENKLDKWQWMNLQHLVEEAKKRAPLMLEAQEMLRRWEARDPEVYGLWEMMNGWVYDGFDVTYKALGVDFDKVYYESQTYLLGKDIVQKGLDMGIFYRREDGSVWIDLTADGLDQKLLLRGDGTSVYMTQDLGTAYRRFEENDLDDMIYVVGNEQNYHFQVLKLVLKKLGYDWSDHITHLSYGMVELPNGKMKSREGTVVDADDLIDDMVRTAREMSDELGKLDDCTEDEAAAISRMVGLGALKYFILKVDPKKTMLFDPRESIDFNGNTGPFIQYTHARIRSVLRKAQEAGIACGEASAAAYLPEEVALVKQLADYPNVVKAAAENFAPSIVAAYAYELAKQYNAYYHDHSILREEDAAVRAMRLRLSEQVARVIRLAMRLLGIDVPERM